MKISYATTVNFAGVLLTGLLLLSAFDAHAAVKLSDQEISDLFSGKTIRHPVDRSSKDGFFGGTGWALINAPVEEVWQALVDFNSYANYYKYTNTVRETARKGQRSLVRMDLGYKILRVSYFLDVKKDRDNWTLRYRLDTNRPHDIDDARGYWRLLPQKGGKTLVAYVASIQIPKGLANFLGESKRKSMERYVLGAPGQLKKWVEKSASGKTLANR